MEGVEATMTMQALELFEEAIKKALAESLSPKTCVAKKFGKFCPNKVKKGTHLCKKHQDYHVTKKTDVVYHNHSPCSSCINGCPMFVTS